MDEPSSCKRHEPWLAVTLSSYLPGLGQLLVGRRARGWTILAVYLLLSSTGFVAFVTPEGSVPLGFACLALAGLLWIALLFGAHRCALSLNDPGFETLRRSQKDAWLAVFLTRLLPGLGHVYLGRVGMGVLTLVVVFGATPLATWLATPLAGDLVCGIALGLACTHVYRSAPSRRETSRLAIGWVTALVAVTTFAAGATPDLLRAHVVQAFRMPSESMLPTLRPGDFMFASKWRSEPRIGDVVVFAFPADTTKDFVKRVVAGPGDTLEIRDRILFVNGVRQQDSRAFHADPSIQAEPPRDQLAPVALNRNEYFVLGDHRENSNDSRFWGPVPRRHIHGRVYKIYWPLRRAGALR
jgi:signal peptidase I